MNCEQGDHDLVLITSYPISPYEDNIVHWCRECGAIVGDIGSDNRIMKPGGWFKMSLPRKAKCK